MAQNPTTSTNNCVQEFKRVSKVAVLAASVFNCGDLAKWQSSSLTPVAVDPGGTDAAVSASAALILGVFNDTQPVASLGGVLPKNICNIIVSGIFQFFVDDAATYYQGDTVTIGQNAQTVRKTGASAGNSIGIAAPENFFQINASSCAGITPGVGGTLLVALKAQDINQIAGG